MSHAIDYLPLAFCCGAAGYLGSYKLLVPQQSVLETCPY